MNYEADRELHNQGVLLSKIHHNEGLNGQKLSLYNEVFPTGESTPNFSESLKNDDVKLVTSDRLELLRNLRFIKEKQAYMFDASKTGASQHKK